MSDHSNLERDVKVSVDAQFIPQQSSVERDYYFFAYRVTIINQGQRAAQLISRHWVITDGEGRTEEVRGPGVVGDQPHLKPGERYVYTSACPLPTPIGTMSGTYHMIDDRGETFEADIPIFSLRHPELCH